jgi:beta-mannosidase
MKKTLKVLMMLGCFPMMLSAKEYKKSESLSLDKGWEFAQVGRNEWLPATVPGRLCIGIGGDECSSKSHYR